MKKYYTFENKLYVIENDVVKFFSSWNQKWWTSSVTADILTTKGNFLL